MIFTIAIIALVTVFISIYRHLTKHRGELEKMGFPIVKPIGLFGSPPFDWHNHWLHLEYLERFKKFGKTFGYYEGNVPILATIDTEIIKSVLVKNFDSFTDIIDSELVDDKHSTLDAVGGKKWRDLRKVLSPTFTSGKLKGMLEPMAGVAEQMVNYVDEIYQSNPMMDIKEVFQGMAMNTIGRCAFGIDVDAYKNPDQDLIKYGTLVFQGFRADNWIASVIFQIILHFPVTAKILPLFPKEYLNLHDITNGIMQQREKESVLGNDFIARLMELKKLVANNPNDEHLSTLNDDIITAQGIVFFLAGYETTANTLSTLTYNLAKYPEAQQTIYEEISEVMENNGGVIDHETINQMEYLDAALQENLRLNGPVTNHFRLCNKDCEVAPGVVVKKGMRVDMPVYACHHNPEYFPDPDKFQPERFLKENKANIIPYTWRPFGGGPRLCIGQRFAWVEMKLAMAKLLLKYRFVDTPETKLKPYKGDQFFFTFPSVKVKLERR